MARMYSRKKGKSGSKKPKQKVAKWVDYKPKEIEDLVIKYAKQGMQSAKGNPSGSVRDSFCQGCHEENDQPDHKG